MSEDNIFSNGQADILLDLLTEQKTVRSPKLLTKSKFLNGLQCHKLLWTRCNAPQDIPAPSEHLQTIFDTGHRVGELAISRYPDGTRVQEDDFIKNLEQTRALLASKTPKPIYEAGIQAGRLYARADILDPSRTKPGHWDVIEVKCSTGLKEVYIQDIAFQRYCYEQAGLRIDRCYLLHVNNTYVRQGNIDPQGFFTLLDVTAELNDFSKMIPAIVKEHLRTIDLPASPNVAIREYCTNPYECPMKPICWAFLPEANVTQFYNARSKKKFELIDQGFVRIKDVPEDVDLTHNQQIQRACAISGGEHINKPEFSPIPRFDGIRPYQQIPFQFSVHIKRTPTSTLEHVSFLHKSADDPRRAFIESLSAYIKDKGDIIAYNFNFEKSRLKELANTFPEYSAFCEHVTLRMVDLLVPFRSFHYYHPDQKGSASLKKVLPVLVDGNGYANLTIADGAQASMEYVRVTYGKEVTATDRNQVYADLETYCALDTEAMVDILGSLQRMI